MRKLRRRISRQHFDNRKDNIVEIESKHVGKECTVVINGKKFQAYILNRGDDGMVKIEDDRGVIGWIPEGSITEVLA